MAQPPFVPSTNLSPLSYTSPPRRGGSWRADRPGEVVGTVDPEEFGLGNPGPDQGYVLKLAPLVTDEIELGAGEHHDDVIAGCAAVALKRASLFGRGPIIHDLRAGLKVWGYLDPSPAPELVARRRAMFAGASHPHHYLQRRAIADAVPSRLLAEPHGKITSAALVASLATADTDR